MVTHAQQRLEQRVVAAAEEALDRQQYVSAIDVLAGLGWLHPTHVKDWRSGRVPSGSAASVTRPAAPTPRWSSGWPP